MLPDRSWKNIRRIAQKETTLFFTSPVAYLFLAAFGAISFFTVFWGEAFFARNIADARPLFEWMPIFLIFLCSALTMRLWSEERRTGTLEHVLTTPVPLWNFVMGKFLACLALLGSALFITLPFPVTVSFLGDLDWGPVLAGYLATFLLGATYLAIGLFVSSRTTNQIVSLIGAIGVSGVFYLIGSPMITELFSLPVSDTLQLLGTGSRFESITRGVLDLRDLAYYLGLIITFLTLNAYILESERWSQVGARARKADWRMIVGLIVANAVGLNLWLGQVSSARIDMTEGNQYSLSETTVDQLESLREPIIIKAYFSKKTHPLLAPLVPQLRDLLKEYEVAADGSLSLEFIDPQENPEAEQEAKERYGIEPVPFQVADRYEASIVSSYFHLVIKYGDSFQTLGFRDLIEVKGRGADQIDVHLRNPEYDITRTIKKTVDSYKKEGEIFNTLSQPVTLRLFLSEQPNLPEKLREYATLVQTSAKDLKQQSEGKLVVETFYPDQNEGDRAMADELGLRPMTTSLLDNKQFYLYVLLVEGDRMIQVPMGDLTKETFERNLKAGLKRFGSGFAKTVAVAGGPSTQINQLKRFLGDELNVETEDLSDGSVTGEADILVLAGTDKLDGDGLLAVDQFLMRGGTVIATTSPYSASMGSNQLKLQKKESKLNDWLRFYGVDVQEKLILDPQSAALPIPVTRYSGGYRMQQMQMVSYPYFVDVREDGFAEKHPALAELSQLTFTWPSPIVVDQEKNKERNVVELVKSSPESWTSTDTNIMPRVDGQGRAIFAPGNDKQRHNLAVVVSGNFGSYFESEEGKKLLDEDSSTLITQSPDSARLIVLSSPSMFADDLVRLLGSLGAGDPLGNFTFMANLIDWSTEDESLLSIRSRSHFKRTLYPLDKKEQMIWELVNYAMALVLLIGVGVFSRLRIENLRRRYDQLLDS